MRQSLLLSAAIGSLLAGIGAASAAGLVPSALMFGQPYVEFGGGLNFTAVTLTNLTGDDGVTPGSTTPLGIGGVFYGTVGAELMPGVRGEIQASVRSNAGARFNVSGEGNGSVGVSAQTFMLLANFWKDFDLGNGLSMHVGGGLGVGHKTLMVTGAEPATQSANGLAFLVGVGADYKVASNMALTFNYTVSGVSGAFGTSTIDSDDPDDNFTGVLNKGLDQSATVGLRIALAP